MITRFQYWHSWMEGNPERTLKTTNWDRLEVQPLEHLQMLDNLQGRYQDHQPRPGNPASVKRVEVVSSEPSRPESGVIRFDKIETGHYYLDAGKSGYVWSSFYPYGENKEPYKELREHNVGLIAHAQILELLLIQHPDVEVTIDHHLADISQDRITQLTKWGVFPYFFQRTLREERDIVRAYGIRKGLWK